ncbi:ATP-binding protein [Halobacillus locisalis]|uniref:ATP-binding protein n=1 Tax=Halobacillus locisalis TaxID=220753 RepID=UPI001C681D2C|nr:ATP-binding protein [Halobacillus locisalis]
MNKAKLPYIKSIHDFDFSFQPSIDQRRVKEVLSSRYIHNGEILEKFFFWVPRW